ncbi:GAF domain-containing protein [Streptomyces violaceusniger]|uniref:GAF domain-containing protein n=1 Tax=Streptomyces violaceusniger TaxID=68280 RepID=UPI0009C21C66|nr:PAS/PAC sensor protein [Streptomyces hygroscopicus]
MVRGLFKKSATGRDHVEVLVGLTPTLAEVMHMAGTKAFVMLERPFAVGSVDSFPIDSPLIKCVISGEPAMIRPGQSVTSLSRTRNGDGTVMTVPLRARGTLLGVARLTRQLAAEETGLLPFNNDDLVLAEELAARTAICIDNALRYARESSIAVTLQRSLLPQDPAPPRGC